jgi:hypothetical protein
MKKADNFDATKWLVENKITSQSNLKEEPSQFNGKNLDFYKENFKLLKTKETPKNIVYTFELPQEINDKVIPNLSREEYKELYKKRNYFAITVPKLEGLYKPEGLFLPQGNALEDYLKTL